MNVQTPTKPYLFGFRIDPLDKMRHTQSQIANLWRLYHDKPIFGVEMDEDVCIIF